MNRKELENKLGPITSELLRNKGYIALVDVFVKMGYLTEKDVENWRMKRISYLEKSIMVGLGKVSYIVKTVRSNCLKGNLKPSFTSYKSWGKGAKVTLQFSRSGEANLEEAYATHFVKSKS